MLSILTSLQLSVEREGSTTFTIRSSPGWPRKVSRTEYTPLLLLPMSDILPDIFSSVNSSGVSRRGRKSASRYLEYHTKYPPKMFLSSSVNSSSTTKCKSQCYECQDTAPQFSSRYQGRMVLTGLGTPRDACNATVATKTRPTRVPAITKDKWRRVVKSDLESNMKIYIQGEYRRYMWARSCSINHATAELEQENSPLPTVRK